MMGVQGKQTNENKKMKKVGKKPTTERAKMYKHFFFCFFFLVFLLLLGTDEIRRLWISFFWEQV